MAFRRETFQRFGSFSTDLGRKARSLLSCEEIELCLRIERGGGQIVYVPQARVSHVVEGGRIDRGWLLARFRAQGASEAIVEWQHAGFRGLGVGLKRGLRRALLSHRSREPDERLVRNCERATVRGYLLGSARAPLQIPRYKPSPEAGPAKKWRPNR
jgi:GT2 family glycosyltransferase